MMIPIGFAFKAAFRPCCAAVKRPVAPPPAVSAMVFNFVATVCAIMAAVNPPINAVTAGRLSMTQPTPSDIMGIISPTLSVIDVITPVIFSIPTVS